MTDEKDIKDTAPVPHTDDGIPKVVNGQPLSDTAIQALREAKAREAEKIKKAFAKYGVTEQQILKKYGEESLEDFNEEMVELCGNFFWTRDSHFFPSEN